MWLIKVQTLWGHKVWKKSPTCFDKTLVLLSSIKTSGRFFQIFVAFSEKLDFTIKWMLMKSLMVGSVHHFRAEEILERKKVQILQELKPRVEIIYEVEGAYKSCIFTTHL